MASEKLSALRAVRTLLKYIGENPDRNGLEETPERVVRSYEELFSGYKTNPKTLLKEFDGIPSTSMILLDGIEFYSCCEHHMMPFTGTAAVAYIPSGDRVVGVSKLARLVDVYARRLQVQERLGAQIVQTLMEQLKPKGAACFIEARHFCMCARGVNKQNSVLKTSSLEGLFLTDPAVRAEFLSLVKGA